VYDTSASDDPAQAPPTLAGALPGEIIKFGKILVFLRELVPTGGSKTTTVNHVTLQVPDIRKMVDKARAAGYSARHPRRTRPADVGDGRPGKRRGSASVLRPSKGIKLDRPCAEVPGMNIASPFLADPWGTHIELTEGLASVWQGGLPPRQKRTSRVILTANVRFCSAG
jgi:hypothetical protein